MNRICPDCGLLHDVQEWPENHRLWNEVLCAPMVIRDGLDDLFHPCDNRRYDSKRAFRKTTTAYGRIEVGTEPIKDRRWVDKPAAEDVYVAKQMVEQGYQPHLATADKSDMNSIIATIA